MANKRKCQIILLINVGHGYFMTLRDFFTLLYNVQSIKLLTSDHKMYRNLIKVEQFSHYFK